MKMSPNTFENENTNTGNVNVLVCRFFKLSPRHFEYLLMDHVRIKSYGVAICYLCVTFCTKLLHSSISRLSPQPPFGLGVRPAERGRPDTTNLSGNMLLLLRLSKSSSCLTFTSGLQFLPLWWTPLKEKHDMDSVLFELFKTYHSRISIWWPISEKDLVYSFKIDFCYKDAHGIFWFKDFLNIILRESG